MAAADANAPEWGRFGRANGQFDRGDESRPAANSPGTPPATLRRHRLTAANDQSRGRNSSQSPIGPPVSSPLASRRGLPPGDGPLSARNLHLWVEAHLHTIVPALVVLFLLSIALLRGLVLLDMREQALDDARSDLHLGVRFIERDVGAELADALARFEGAPTDIMLAVARDRAERALADAAGRMSEGATLLLVDAADVVVAGSERGYAGRPLSDVVRDRTLVDAGEAAGVRDVPIAIGDGMDQGIAAIAVARSIEGGRLVAWRTRSDVLTRWRDRLSANAALFAFTFVVLMTLLAIYFAQARRARDRDELQQDAMRRMESALGRGRCGLWQWDVTRGSVRWSRSMYDILGLPVPDHRGGVLSFGEMRQHMHPDEDILLAVARDVVSRRTDHMDAEFRMRHASGEWVWVRARCEVEHSSGGPFMSGIAMDVTDQREVARAKRAAEERLDDAVRNVSEAFVLWDADDRLVMCNDKFREWFDLPLERVEPGTPRAVVLSPMQRAARTRALDEAPAAEDGAGRSYEVRLAGGRSLQVSERRMSDGSLAVIGTDVTLLRHRTDEAKKSEARLRASLKSLNASEARRRQRERDLEAATRELKAQKEAAEKASTAKSDFMANMSHELRTPLNAIIGFSEMMGLGLFGPLGADEESAARYGEYAKDIHSSASHLLDVIGDILDMSRIEAGRFDLHLERVDICPVVEESVRIIALKAAEKGITVDTSITRYLSLDADERAIKQVLLNILSNAVKFTPEGGRITVNARRSRGQMRLAITDTGIGIPEDAVERVLCPFEQVQNRYTREHEGSGLGLAISRSLIEMHNGRMRVKSEVGVGTTVSILVPLAGSKSEIAALENDRPAVPPAPIGTTDVAADPDTLGAADALAAERTAPGGTPGPNRPETLPAKGPPMRVGSDEQPRAA